MSDSKRTTQEVIEAGLRALVDALGRDDAHRFLEEFSPPPQDEETPAPPLPSMSVEEAHQKIRDMNANQAGLL